MLCGDCQHCPYIGPVTSFHCPECKSTDFDIYGIPDSVIESGDEAIKAYVEDSGRATMMRMWEKLQV